ncbi:MAG: nuclear transport factor 2 family protein [Pseudomonadales bacterium]|nr:nuclear transport factor 2 family protein [Pseudomonadales bacterium]
MKLEVALLEADAQRRAAMIAGDVSVLDRLLSDDLIWTHSSGKSDSKSALLEAIGSRAVVYTALEVTDVRVSAHGAIFLCHGTLQGSASRNAVAKNLSSRFLSVWKHESGTFELLAWQSTGI